MTLTRYDPEKGRFVLAGTKAPKLKCSCHPDNPFHWQHDKRPSIFMKDVIFRAGGAAIAQNASQRIEEQRAQGLNPGAIKGISRDREAEVLRMRSFTQFLRAVPSAEPEQKDTSDKVPAVRGMDKRTGIKNA